MRVALHSVVRAGAERQYEAEHERIPDDLVAAFARVGIWNWTIWRSGSDLFHIVDCEDFDAAMRELQDDPANVRWQARIGPFVDRFVSDAGDGAPHPIGQVWELTTQRSQS
ncbi:L-rhamnose mutarotase [Phytoactinopolyspora halotolerans]|uniref:L-rhamnose mutarotase n=1 Tax=Phytoactinopolyspora halotolerans TaxID=1981512 RepID=A0A6L9SDX7_9ACTN|nr:L-rhamnose mutarotase [Phytoactinopolyspora halotolerans]NEE02814.1 L-rhamnose mutarotase [Phytoactinopolyspora halotolerans]